MNKILNYSLLILYLLAFAYPANAATIDLARSTVDYTDNVVQGAILEFVWDTPGLSNEEVRYLIKNIPSEFDVSEANVQISSNEGTFDKAIKSSKIALKSTTALNGNLEVKIKIPIPSGCPENTYTLEISEMVGSDSDMTSPSSIVITVQMSSTNPPSVTVLYQNCGESIPIGTQVQVSAHATDATAITGVSFHYSRDDGSNWTLIGEGVKVSGTDKDGTWNRTWNTDGLSAGTNYMIKAVASDGASTSEDQSDGTFSLTPSELIRVPVDYPTIQAAIDAASSGHIINVSPGTYFEHLVIDKPLKLIGEDKNTTIINGSGSGSCVHITADNVEISGFTIKKGVRGVYLESSNESILDKNIISDNEVGIYLINSNNNMITNNSLFNNVLSLSGIHLSSSNNNVIRDNDLVENDIGVSLRESNNNLIYHNNFIDNIIRQAFDDTGTNSWDKGPVEGGNYWSDHSCIGNPSDKPYSIYSDGVDHYPFQDQNGWLKGNQPPVTSGNAGAISVSSSPSGAAIHLEGFVGPSIKTPYTITNVPVGMCTITLSLDGYPDWSTSVYVMAGKTSYVDATLDWESAP